MELPPQTRKQFNIYTETHIHWYSYLNHSSEDIPFLCTHFVTNSNSVTVKLIIF